MNIEKFKSEKIRKMSIEVASLAETVNGDTTKLANERDKLGLSCAKLSSSLAS